MSVESPLLKESANSTSACAAIAFRNVSGCELSCRNARDNACLSACRAGFSALLTPPMSSLSIKPARRKPEMELVVVRVAIDFPREKIFCGLEIPAAHGCQAKIEKMEGWIGLQLLQLTRQRFCIRQAAFVVVDQRQV